MPKLLPDSKARNKMICHAISDRQKIGGLQSLINRQLQVHAINGDEEFLPLAYGSMDGVSSGLFFLILHSTTFQKLQPARETPILVP